MAINQRGRLQFISSEFGTDGVRTEIVAGGDTGYHARAMKHFIWLAWQGIPEAREVFLQWCEDLARSDHGRDRHEAGGFHTGQHLLSLRRYRTADRQAVVRQPLALLRVLRTARHDR
jgi:hypothetical protein